MAKIKDTGKEIPTDDLNFDSLDNFDSDFDFDFGDEPTPGERSPAKDFKAGVAKKVMSADSVSKNLLKQVDKHFPETGSVVEAATNSYSVLESLRRDIMKEVSPLTNQLRITTKQLLPRVKMLMPESIYDKLSEKLEEASETHKQADAEQQKKEARDQSIAAQLSAIFDAKHQEEKAEAARITSEKMVERTLDQVKFNKSYEVSQKSAHYLKELLKFQLGPTRGYMIKSLDLKFRTLYGIQDTVELLKHQLKIQEEKLEAIKHNTGLPEFVKERRGEEFQKHIRNTLYGKVTGTVRTGLLGTNVLTKVSEVLKDKFKSTMGDTIDSVKDMLENVQTMIELEDEMEDMGGEVSAHQKSGGVVGLLINAIGYKVLGDRLRRLKYLNRANKMVSVEKRQLEALAETRGKRGDNLLDNLAGAVFEKGSATSFALKKNLADTQYEPTPFDVMSRRALVDIIPSLLSKIHNVDMAHFNLNKAIWMNKHASVKDIDKTTMLAIQTQLKAENRDINDRNIGLEWDKLKRRQITQATVDIDDELVFSKNTETFIKTKDFRKQLKDIAKFDAEEIIYKGLRELVEEIIGKYLSIHVMSERAIQEAHRYRFPLFKALHNLIVSDSNINLRAIAIHRHRLDPEHSHVDKEKYTDMTDLEDMQHGNLISGLDSTDTMAVITILDDVLHFGGIVDAAMHNLIFDGIEVIKDKARETGKSVSEKIAKEGAEVFRHALEGGIIDEHGTFTGAKKLLGKVDRRDVQNYKLFSTTSHKNIMDKISTIYAKDDFQRWAMNRKKALGVNALNPDKRMFATQAEREELQRQIDEAYSLSTDPTDEVVVNRLKEIYANAKQHGNAHLLEYTGYQMKKLSGQEYRQLTKEEAELNGRKWGSWFDENLELSSGMESQLINKYPNLRASGKTIREMLKYGFVNLYDDIKIDVKRKFKAFKDNLIKAANKDERLGAFMDGLLGGDFAKARAKVRQIVKEDFTDRVRANVFEKYCGEMERKARKFHALMERRGIRDALKNPKDLFYSFLDNEEKTVKEIEKVESTSDMLAGHAKDIVSRATSVSTEAQLKAQGLKSSAIRKRIQEEQRDASRIDKRLRHIRGESSEISTLFNSIGSVSGKGYGGDIYESIGRAFDETDIKDSNFVGAVILATLKTVKETLEAQRDEMQATVSAARLAGGTGKNAKLISSLTKAIDQVNNDLILVNGALGSNLRSKYDKNFIPTGYTYKGRVKDFFSLNWYIRNGSDTLKDIIGKTLYIYITKLKDIYEKSDNDAFKTLLGVSIGASSGIDGIMDEIQSTYGGDERKWLIAYLNGLNTNEGGYDTLLADQLINYQKNEKHHDLKSLLIAQKRLKRSEPTTNQANEWGSVDGFFSNFTDSAMGTSSRPISLRNRANDIKKTMGNSLTKKCIAVSEKISGSVNKFVDVLTTMNEGYVKNNLDKIDKRREEAKDTIRQIELLLNQNPDTETAEFLNKEKQTLITLLGEMDEAEVTVLSKGKKRGNFIKKGQSIYPGMVGYVNRSLKRDFLPKYNKDESIGMNLGRWAANASISLEGVRDDLQDNLNTEEGRRQIRRELEKRAQAIGESKGVKEIQKNFYKLVEMFNPEAREEMINNFSAYMEEHADSTVARSVKDIGASVSRVKLAAKGNFKDFKKAFRDAREHDSTATHDTPGYSMHLGDSRYTNQTESLIRSSKGLFKGPGKHQYKQFEAVEGHLPMSTPDKWKESLNVFLNAGKSMFGADTVEDGLANITDISSSIIPKGFGDVKDFSHVTEDINDKKWRLFKRDYGSPYKNTVVHLLNKIANKQSWLWRIGSLISNTTVGIAKASVGMAKVMATVGMFSLKGLGKAGLLAAKSIPFMFKGLGWGLDKVFSGIKFGLTGIGKTAAGVGNVLTAGRYSERRWFDVYIKDDIDIASPLCRASAQKGAVFENGKPLQGSHYIDEPIYDRKGNCLISAEDIQAGIVDRFNRPIGKLSIIGGIIKGTGRLVGGVASGTYNLGKKTVGLAYKGLTAGLGALKQPFEAMMSIYASMFKLGIGAVKKIGGFFYDRFMRPLNRKDLMDVVGKRLDTIISLMKKKVMFDTDGNGLRDGSVAELEIEERKRKEEWKKNKPGFLKKALGAAKGAVSSLTTNVSNMFGGMGGLFGGSGILGGIGGTGGGGGSWLSKAGAGIAGFFGINKVRNWFKKKNKFKLTIPNSVSKWGNKIGSKLGSKFKGMFGNVVNTLKNVGGKILRKPKAAIGMALVSGMGLIGTSSAFAGDEETVQKLAAVQANNTLEEQGLSGDYVAVPDGEGGIAVVNRNNPLEVHTSEHLMNDAEYHAVHLDRFRDQNSYMTVGETQSAFSNQVSDTLGNASLAAVSARGVGGVAGRHGSRLGAKVASSTMLKKLIPGLDLAYSGASVYNAVKAGDTKTGIISGVGGVADALILGGGVLAATGVGAPAAAVLAAGGGVLKAGSFAATAWSSYRELNRDTVFGTRPLQIELTKRRFETLGFDMKDYEAMYEFGKAEYNFGKALAANIKANGADAKAYVTPKMIHDLMKDGCGFNPKDEAHIQIFNAWFNRRFWPMYSGWIQTLDKYRVKPDQISNLSEADMMKLFSEYFIYSGTLLKDPDVAKTMPSKAAYDKAIGRKEQSTWSKVGWGAVDLLTSPLRLAGSNIAKQEFKLFQTNAENDKLYKEAKDKYNKENKILEQGKNKARVAMAATIAKPGLSKAEPVVPSTSNAFYAFPTILQVITSPFGPRSIKESKSNFHDGIDLRAKMHEPIFAWADGRVLCTRSSVNPANIWIVIEHGDKTTSSYGHLSYCNVCVGDKVVAGQIIGRAGNDNRPDMLPHLHFQIHDNLGPVNPDEMFRYRLGSSYKPVYAFGASKTMSKAARIAYSSIRGNRGYRDYFHRTFGIEQSMMAKLKITEDNATENSSSPFGSTTSIFGDQLAGYDKFDAKAPKSDGFNVSKNLQERQKSDPAGSSTALAKSANKQGNSVSKVDVNVDNRRLESLSEEQNRHLRDMNVALSKNNNDDVVRAIKDLNYSLKDFVANEARIRNEKLGRNMYGQSTAYDVTNKFSTGRTM